MTNYRLTNATNTSEHRLTNERYELSSHKRKCNFDRLTNESRSSNRLTNEVISFFYVSRLTNHRGHHGRRQLIRVRGGGHGATAVHFARRHLRHVGTGRSHGIGHSHARVQAQHGDTAPTSTLQWHARAASYTSLTSRPPDRCSQWTVWFFDTSKQGFAGVLQHFVNLAFGVIFARSSSASECSWYLVNFTISVACGVVLLWGIMKGYDHCVNRYQITLLRSGEYGNPPSWKPWLAQLLIWGFFASGEKVLTAIVVIMPLHAHLDVFAAYIEQPLLDFPALELLLVMVCAPVILNIGFFWVIDNIIMRKRAPNYLGNYLGHEIEGGLSAKRVPGDPNPFQLASHHAPTMPPTTITPVAQEATMMTNRSTSVLCSRTAVDAARPSRPRRARVEATRPPRALLSRWLRPARSPPAATRPPNAGPNSCSENEV